MYVGLDVADDDPKTKNLVPYEFLERFVLSMKEE